MARIEGDREILTQPLYDSAVVDLVPGPIQAWFFVDPVGTAASTWASLGVTGPKTYADTNMTLGGELPLGWSFEIFTVQVGLQLRNTAPVDVIPSIRGAVLTLLVQAKSQLDIPVPFLPAGGGAYSRTDTTQPVNADHHVSIGTPGPKAVFALGDRPIRLEGGEMFSVRIGWATTTGVPALMFFKLILGGRLSRPRQ